MEPDDPFELKFVPIDSDDAAGGGWYRELPDGQLEIMARAQLERVPVDETGPESQARAVVEKLIKRQPT